MDVGGKRANRRKERRGFVTDDRTDAGGGPGHSVDGPESAERLPAVVIGRP
ncbi:hypothetical protein SDC9_100285 [bioreactor metagenome]|uniref:Uncharacterized protein n=1 Tax=bioreactor metagenome TaxID=1076179 RepID=A0A645AKF2_9ZZZZ